MAHYRSLSTLSPQTVSLSGNRWLRPPCSWGIGFRFHPTVRNKLVIDGDSAAVVRRIFDMTLQGKHPHKAFAILTVTYVLNLIYHQQPYVVQGHLTDAADLQNGSMNTHPGISRWWCP